MAEIVAQRGRFHDQTISQIWQDCNGELIWVKYGPPNKSGGCGEVPTGCYIEHVRSRKSGGEVCSRCIELLPEFKLSDGRIINGY